MESANWVSAAAAVGALLIAVFAAIVAVRAHRLATEADKRAERSDRLSRVHLELVRDPGEPSVYSLVNRGTEAAELVTIDPASVIKVAFRGSTRIGNLVPGVRSIPFQLGEWGEVPAVEALRVTWLEPFAGEQYVPLPPDPNEKWSYVIYG